MIFNRCVDITVIVVIYMQMILIDLIPEKHLCIILELLDTIRRTRHIQHHASDLIRRIVSCDSPGNRAVSVCLVQDLLHRDRAVKASCI